MTNFVFSFEWLDLCVSLAQQKKCKVSPTHTDKSVKEPQPPPYLDAVVNLKDVPNKEERLKDKNVPPPRTRREKKVSNTIRHQRFSCLGYAHTQVKSNSNREKIIFRLWTCQWSTCLTCNDCVSDCQTQSRSATWTPACRACCHCRSSSETSADRSRSGVWTLTLTQQLSGEAPSHIREHQHVQYYGWCLWHLPLSFCRTFMDIRASHFSVDGAHKIRLLGAFKRAVSLWNPEFQDLLQKVSEQLSIFVVSTLPDALSSVWKPLSTTVCLHRMPMSSSPLCCTSWGLWPRRCRCWLSALVGHTAVQWRSTCYSRYNTPGRAWGKTSQQHTVHTLICDAANIGIFFFFFFFLT